MKYLYISILIIIFCAATWFYYGKNYTEFASQDLQEMMAEAAAIGIGDINEQKAWVKANKEIKDKIALLKFDGLDSELEEVKKIAAQKSPKDYDARYQFIIEQMNAAVSFNNIIDNNSIGDKEFEIIKTRAKNNSGDYVEMLKSAQALVRLIENVNSFKELISPAEFKTVYSVYMQDFAKSPDAATTKALKELESVRNFESSNIAPKIAGVKEFLKKNYPLYSTRFELLNRAIHDDVAFLDKVYLNPIATERDWNNSDVQELKNIAQNSLYFAEIDGKSLPVFYVSYENKGMFIAPAGVIANGIKDIEIKRGDEVLKCVLWRYSSRNFGVVLIPDKAPKGRAINADNQKNFFDSFKICGINAFGGYVYTIIYSSGVEMNNIKFYPSDLPEIYAMGTLLLDSKDNSLLGVKLFGEYALKDEQMSAPADILKDFASKYPDASQTLYENLKSCKRLPFSGYTYAPSFARVSTILRNPLINIDSDAQTYLMLQEFTKHNKAMLNALGKNQYSYMLSDEFAQMYPEMYKLAESAKSFLLGDKKYSRSIFAKNYSIYLNEILKRLIQERKEIESAKLSALREIQLARELEIRNAIIKTLVSLNSGKYKLEEVLHADLRPNFDGAYYWVKK